MVHPIYKKRKFAVSVFRAHPIYKRVKFAVLVIRAHPIYKKIKLVILGIRVHPFSTRNGMECCFSDGFLSFFTYVILQMSQMLQIFA